MLKHVQTLTTLCQGRGVPGSPVVRALCWAQSLKSHKLRGTTKGKKKSIDHIIPKIIYIYIYMKRSETINTKVLVVVTSGW